MPYDDVNTSLSDLKAGFNLDSEVSGTLFDYDKSSDKNLWGNFSGNKSLIQDSLTMNNAQINQTGKGFETMGAKTELEKKLSDGANAQVGMNLDDTMYGQYKNKTKWLDENMGTISDSILAGDTTVNENYDPNAGNNDDDDNDGDDGTDPNGPEFTPSGYSGTPYNGDTWTDNDGQDWVFGPMGWTETYDCFVEGTKIFMSDGSEREIQDIIEGDLILTFDEKTKSFTPGVVTESLIHPVYRDVKVAIVGGVLEGTPNHPIFFNGNWSEIKESKADIKIVKKYIDNYFNLEVDAHDIHGSSHNYIANGYVVSGLGDNNILNNTFRREKNLRNGAIYAPKT